MIDVQHHGSNADGSVSSDYCVYCFQHGDFTSPTLTKSEMVEIAARYWAIQNRTTVEAARRQVALKRGADVRAGGVPDDDRGEPGGKPVPCEPAVPEP
jgi:hypothetical protein